MSKKIKEFNLNKKPHKPILLVRIIMWTISWFMTGIFGSRTKFKKVGFDSYKEPSLILSNHGSMIDFGNMARAMFPYKQCWVAAVEEFNGREFFLRAVGGIPKRKFTTDLLVVKRVAELIRNDHTSVVIYPEARFSIAGINEDIGDALGKMAKLCKCRVIVVKQEGNYLRYPQWRKHHYHVQNTCTSIQVVSKDEVATLSAEQIQEKIDQTFVYDEYKWQKENNVLIKTKKRAQNIHRILYKCPCCNQEFEITSNGSQIMCNCCKSKWEMQENGTLKCLTGETRFTLVSDWYRWEREEVNKEVENGTYHFEDDVRIEKLFNSHIKFQRIGVIHMSHDENGYILDGTLDNGSHFHLEKPCISMRSVHIEYDYKGRGDALDLATLEESWFVFPLHAKNHLTKFHFATEALFFKCKKMNK